MEHMTDYREIKSEQIKRYEVKCREFRLRGNLLLIPIVAIAAWVMLSLLLAELWAELFQDAMVALIFIALSIPLALIAEYVLCKLRRNAVKSALLLQQLVDALQKVLNRKQPDEGRLKREILEIETKFLANDDELFAKKFMWRPYLAFVNENARYEASPFGPKPVVWRMDLPPVWLEGDPLKTDYKDRSIVLSDWKIRLKLRELWFYGSYQTKHRILSELNRLAQVNVIVYERFLRSKKVSKYLKKFKKAARVFYLSSAAKMNLVAFVNRVISERPYKRGGEETEELLAAKNEQIEQYTADFWKVHRRSLKFYLFEALWLGWLIPFLVLAFYLWQSSSVVLAALVFFAGAAIVVYGEMMLVTRQMIDLKGKKLMPPLIASLIGIRHSMCENAGEEDTAGKYRKYFKNAEKHFILTTKEIESVKYVQENLKDKVEEELPPASTLCLQKKEQLKSYYAEFNHYRRQCMKYGCLEAFVALMIIPVYGFAFWVGQWLGADGVDLAINIGYWAIGVVMEIILIQRHIRVWRYKELYLLLYQELSVTLADPEIRRDHGRLVEIFQKTEQDAIGAAKLDGMDDAVAFIYHVSGLNADPRKKAGKVLPFPQE